MSRYGTDRRSEPGTPTPAPASAMLFVHGVGSQGEGDTLTAWSRPIREYLAALASRNNRAQSPDGVLSIECRQQPSTERRRHERWTLRVGDEERVWLVTESWWDRSFEPASSATFIRWSFSIFPRFAIFHLWAAYGTHYHAFWNDRYGVCDEDGRQVRAPRPARAFARGILVGALMPASPLLRSAVVALLLSVIWLAGVLERAGHARLMRSFIASLGDSLAAVADEPMAGTARANMTARIRDDIQWCLGRVSPIFVPRGSRVGA